MNHYIVRCKKIALSIIVIFIVASSSLLAQEKASYLVKPGDTLYGISKKLNVTISELKQWNEISGNEIELGQELIYFLQKKASDDANGLTAANSDPLVNRSAGAQNEYYVVKSGDTLYEISLDHNMTVDEIKVLNNLSSNTLSVGQKLAVRKVSEAPPSVSGFTKKSSPQGVFSVYEMKRGESLAELLNRFKMTELEFQKLNPELDKDRLSSGQDITILLPPSRKYSNPYLQKADLSNLGVVPVTQYSGSEERETTTSGELYAPEELTAAHSNIALGSLIFVENPETGNGVYVRINDRITGSGLKLSQKAFSVLNLKESMQPVVTIYTE